jgi:hypothetical protein
MRLVSVRDCVRPYELMGVTCSDQRFYHGGQYIKVFRAMSNALPQLPQVLVRKPAGAVLDVPGGAMAGLVVASAGGVAVVQAAIQPQGRAVVELLVPVVPKVHPLVPNMHHVLFVGPGAAAELKAAHRRGACASACTCASASASACASACPARPGLWRHCSGPSFISSCAHFRNRRHERRSHCRCNRYYAHKRRPQRAPAGGPLPLRFHGSRNNWETPLM